MAHLSIKTLSELSGLSQHTLRAWERRYCLIKPIRTETNRRQYSFHDLEKLRMIRELVEHGYLIGELAKLSPAKLKKEWLEVSQANQRAQVPSRPDSSNAIDSKSEVAIELAINLIQKYDLQALDAHLTHYRLSHGSLDFVLNLVSPLFTRLGPLVTGNKLSISQEHALSAIIRNQLIQIFLHLSPLADQRLPKLALCTREGDYHEFGILIAAILASHEAYPVIYLGTNLPAQSLAETLKALQLHHLILAANHLPPEHDRVSIDDYLSQLKRLSKMELEVWVGGEGLSLKPQERGPWRIRSISNFQMAWEHLRAKKQDFLSKESKP